MMPNKVLIYTPTWETKPGEYAIHPDCEASIKAQQAGFDGTADWCIGLENPYPVGDYRNVVAQYQKAREILLRDDYYEALLTVEHDSVLPDASVLQRMFDTVGDVIYAPYQLRHEAYCLSTWQYVGDKNLGMSLSHYPDELARYRREGIGRVSGVGHGCTLFRRNVLEQIEFNGGPNGDGSPDIPFAEDALRAGFYSMGRFDAPVKHWDSERNVWLEAYKETTMQQYRAIETVNVVADGKHMRLVAGEVYDLTMKQAQDLQRVGYVQPVEGVETAMLSGTENAMVKPAKRRRVANG